MNIQKSITGQIIKLPQGYNAFVPNPLPPTIEWNNQLVNSLSRADFVLGKLAREGKLYAYKSMGQWFYTGTHERLAQAKKIWKGIE